MKRFIIGLSLLCVCICLRAQKSISTIKIFQTYIDSVYNFYIDSINTVSGGVVFCFQTTTGKLIKTDFEGNILSNLRNPYSFFTFFNGDTIILKDSVIVKTTNDTIATVKFYSPAKPFQCKYLTASTSDIFTYLDSIGWSCHVQRVFAKTISERLLFYIGSLSGLCYYQERVYALQSNISSNNGRIVSKKLNNNEDTDITIIPIIDPVGISGYNGCLYVFSNDDKCLYRIVTSEETNINSVKEQRTERESIHRGLDGKVISPSVPGIHIIKYPDNTVKKSRVSFQ